MQAPLRRMADPSVPTGSGDLFELLWASPQPATLQGEDGLLIDVNQAYVDFTGYAREALIGTDPIALQPAEDRELHLSARAPLLARVFAGEKLPAQERRLVDAQGRPRWFRVFGHALRGGSGERLLLALLQDVTAEHQARAQAERTIDELASWFELSPAGMVLYDGFGLIVRSNPAFESLVGPLPVALPEADPMLQRLLGWQAHGGDGGGGRPHPGLTPGAPVLQGKVDLARADGRVLHLAARLRAFDTEGGQRRVMAIVEDLSAEDERDLAQSEIGALMHAAGIGVATFDAARGWRRSAVRAPAYAQAANDAPAGRPAPSAALQSIHRDLVDAGSRGEYEKLQRALRAGERAEVRYAVHHPELGLRWLLTRVEPVPPAADGPGAAGSSRASSVVTLDITEQESTQRRNEELLRELTTILDGSPAGIAYLRDGRLVRCNRRFERMLGFAPGAVAGADLTELFRNRPRATAALSAAIATAAAADPAVAAGDAALADLVAKGQALDVEFDHQSPDGSLAWTSLVLRRASGGAAVEVVAVLNDITRLKSAQGELEALLRERELTFSLSEVGIAWLRGRRIERANAAFAALTGYAPAELAGMDIALTHADTAGGQAWEEAALAALRSQHRWHAERRLKRRDGEARWVQVAMRAVDAADPGAGVVCSLVDIDDRQRAREALLQQTTRTRAMLDSVLVGIVTVGPRGIEWMNRSARRMFAGELGDFAGEPIGSVATDEADHPLRRADWFERLSEGQSETFECRLRGRDGREFWVVGHVVAASGEGRDGQSRQLTFALMDIELRRQAEARIARAQASLQQLIETAPLAIALFDLQPAKRLVQLNQMAGSFFGGDLASLQGAGAERLAGLLGAAQAQTFIATLDLVLDSAGGLQREITRSMDGQARLWDTRFVVLNAGTEAPQVLMVASDVTEQRQAEQARLEAAIAQREMLVKEVHHRIKNNLQGVAGLLQQTAARRPEVQPVLAEAIGQVQAIAQVYGLQVGSGGPVALGGLLVAIAASVQRSHGRVIEIDAGSGRWHLPEAESIPIALSVNELLSNAVKHGDGSPIRCMLEASGEGVAIVVRQRGALPPGFEAAQVSAGVYGLGLVRALLPRRSSLFTLAQNGDEVEARIALQPPAIRNDAAAASPGP